MVVEGVSIIKNNPLNIPDRREVIDQILNSNIDRPGALMVILNELQSQIGFISPEMQQYVATRLHTPVSKVHGVVSFYSFFTTTPRGEHIIKILSWGTACYVGGT